MKRTEGSARSGRRAWRLLQWAGVTAAFALASAASVKGGRAVENQALGAAAFVRQVLTPPGEAPLEARFFTGPVKLNSRNEIITGKSSDPVKKIVGAAPAGERAGMQRFAKILFGVDYFTGRPDPGDRVEAPPHARRSVASS